jgi:hypothetical protein
MSEIKLNWPMNLPPEWMPVIKQHAEKHARSKIEGIIGLAEMSGLTIEVAGANPTDLSIRVQGPPWLLNKIRGGFTD